MQAKTMGSGRGFKKKKGNGSSRPNAQSSGGGNNKSSTNTKIEFDVGDAKKASNVNKNLRRFLDLIEQSVTTYGEYRAELITALEDDVEPKYEEPSMSAAEYANPIDKATDASGWEQRNALI